VPLLAVCQIVPNPRQALLALDQSPTVKSKQCHPRIDPIHRDREQWHTENR
jgi:hypothetical protein